MRILGISAFYHDSAATIVEDGLIVAAAQEERFTRKKQDAAFPLQAIRFCLKEANLDLAQIDYIAFYDKPLLKFERLLETYYNFVPRGLRSFIIAIPVWLREKMFLKRVIKEELAKVGDYKAPLLFPEHHLSHAASAFYPSGFNSSAILTVDGVGEWATTSICRGVGKKIELIKELRFPHSPGLLYSAFTYFLGFRVNLGEYKLMGLAPYGNGGQETQSFVDKIKSELINIYEDGSIWINQEYFNYATGLTMTSNKKWKGLFGIAKRESEAPITQVHCDLALAIQIVTEEIMLKLAQHAQEITGEKHLCMAGGVALNCVANGKIHNSKLFEGLFIQPAAGDAGGSLGAALAAYHIYGDHERTVQVPDGMNGSYLGPKVNENDIERCIKKYNAIFKRPLKELMFKEVASLISEGKVVGWIQGRMEFGPRALGNRSIIGDPRNPEMQKKLNLKIKYRESFRPFAPSVLEESAKKYFELENPSPYMLLVKPVNEDIRNRTPEGYGGFDLKEKLYFERSGLPAITHIDYSARIQTVSKDTNQEYHSLISAFGNITGCDVLINTSFNVRGEPIVCTAEDAYRCFMRTEMDVLVIGDYLFLKEEQPEFGDRGEWKEEFVLD